MSFKNILVHVGDDRRSQARTAVGIALARSFGAKLVGLYHATRERLEAEGGGTARRAFLDATDRESVRSEWRHTTTALERALETNARYCDLAVVGQRDPESAGETARHLAIGLVMGVGRPIVVVPYAGTFKTVGKRVLVAWDASRESTRAVHDAMPILEKAEEVSVCRVNPPREDHEPTYDITAHLAEHGVRAEAHPTVSKLPAEETAVLGRRSLGTGDLLLSAATDFSADLLVMGAYSHSRLRELVLGGTTRYVLEHMTLPVLMSH